MFVSKHVVFLEKEFLLKDNGSKDELEEVQDAQTDTNQLLESKADIHRNEILADPSGAQADRRLSRIHTIPKRYGFLINEQNDVFLIEDNELTTYEEYMNISEPDKWLIVMMLEMDSM